MLILSDPEIDFGNDYIRVFRRQRFDPREFGISFGHDDFQIAG